MAFVLFRNHGRELHHESSEQEREIILYAVVPELFLNMRERNDVNLDFTAVFREMCGELHYLIVSGLACVRHGFKVNAVNYHSALHHHISGNRGVDTAGEQKKSLTRRTKRHSARTLVLTRVNISVSFANLDFDDN